jgi:hypothetical protein
MRRLRVGFVTLPPGRFGLAVRPHYGGLQVVLLDARPGRTRAKACGIRMGEAHPARPGRTAPEREIAADGAPRGGCVVQTAQHQGLACASRRAVPLPWREGQTEAGVPGAFKQYGCWRSPGFHTCKAFPLAASPKEKSRYASAAHSREAPYAGHSGAPTTSASPESRGRCPGIRCSGFRVCALHAPPQ